MKTADQRGWILPATRWRVLFFTTVLLTGISVLIYNHKSVSGSQIQQSSYTPVGPSQTAPIPAGPGSAPGVGNTQPTNTGTNPSSIDSDFRPSSDISFDQPIDRSLDAFPEGTEVHVIGVYRGDDGVKNQPWWANCTDDPGSLTSELALECHRKYAGVKEKEAVSVNITSSDPLVLVLMAYEPVVWTINAREPALIQRIILAGYHAQEITNLPGDIAVDILTHYASPTCSTCRVVAGGFYAYKREGKQYDDALEKIKLLTGLPITSFQGNHKAGYFTVSDSMPYSTYSNDTATLRIEGTKVADVLPLSNHRINLPMGVWNVLVHRQTETRAEQSDLVIMYQLEGHRLSSMFAINLKQLKQGKGVPRSKSCGSNIGYWSETVVNMDRGNQLCFWVEHVSKPWQQEAFEYVAERLSKMDIEIPQTVINSAMRKATKEYELTTYYFGNPEIAGIDTQSSSWYVSPWHPRKYKQNMQREEYVSSQVGWAKSWSQLIKAL